MSLHQHLHLKWCTYIFIGYCCSLVVATNNVAFGKPTYYSTNYPGNSQPSYAVDGNTDNNWSSRSCFGTAHDDLNPWWIVDLLSTYTIGNITIYNRGDAYSERLHDVTVEVFSVNPARCPTAAAALCKQLPGQLAMVSHITCDEEVVGRFVKIRKETVNQFDTMMLCEIEISGIPLHQECGQKVFPATNGRRLHQTTVLGNMTSLKFRLECAISCHHFVGCVGCNFRNVDNTCEMIISPDRNASVVSDSQWDYLGHDLCE
ncbi:pentraxin fusion protein-like [Haliotis cracherodii]|uniref:pentraxin fusion protein-like n=1 Tax=Haliotis cracherodii TaxID=6455 RepID=UPI0039EC360E